MSTALPPLSPLRRIVTGHDAQGRSVIAEDGPSPAQITTPGRDGYRVTNLWRTAPGEGVDAPDTIAAHKGIAPPAGGTVVRIIEWPAEPEDPAELRRQMDRTFAQMYPDAHRDVQPGEHPGMHRTDTVDYAIVLEGEVVAIMEEGETLMRQGDMLVQRGTNHAWANRSGKPVKVAFILVDAKAGP
jgi:mannose-6-phosphate isomerase-like protein (cupin superfamily)